MGREESRLRRSNSRGPKSGDEISFDQHFAEPWVQNPLTALGSSLAPRGRKVRPHQSFGSSSLFPPDAQICSFAKEVTELGMIPQETRSLVHSI